MSSTTIEVLDERTKNIERTVSEIKETVIGYNKTSDERLARVESWMWKVIGALVVMNIFFVPVGVYLLIKLLEIGLTHK